LQNSEHLVVRNKQLVNEKEKKQVILGKFESTLRGQLTEKKPAESGSRRFSPARVKISSVENGEIKLNMDEESHPHGIPII